MESRVRLMPLPQQALRHDHSHHQVVLALRGAADFEIEGYGGQVDFRHGCLVPACDSHHYQGVGSNSHLVMDLSQEAVRRVGDCNHERLFERPRYFTVDDDLQLLLTFTAREARRDSVALGERPRLSEYMTSLFLCSLSERLFGESGSVVCGQQSTGLDLARIDAYIRNHLDETILVEDLARLVYMSTSHFHAVFREVTGQSPHQYLLDVRLRRARDMILTTTWPLADVAQQVGFANQSALTHAFRRAMGVTPGAMRRQKTQ